MAIQSLTLLIDGMSCSHCVRAVTDALSGLDGVDVGLVSVGEAQVQFDDRQTTHDTLFSAIDDAGFDLVSVEAR
jgi:copper chaperone CopZ